MRRCFASIFMLNSSDDPYSFVVCATLPTCVEDDMFFVERHTYLYNKRPSRIGEDVVNRSLHSRLVTRVTQSSGSVWQQQKCVVPKMPVVDDFFQSWAHQAQIGLEESKKLTILPFGSLGSCLA